MLADALGTMPIVEEHTQPDQTVPVSYSRDQMWLARHQPAVLELIEQRIARSARSVAFEMVWRLFEAIDRYGGPVGPLASSELERAMEASTSQPPAKSWVAQPPLALEPAHRTQVGRLLSALVVAIDKQRSASLPT